MNPRERELEKKRERGRESERESGIEGKRKRERVTEGDIERK